MVVGFPMLTTCILFCSSITTFCFVCLFFSNPVVDGPSDTSYSMAEATYARLDGEPYVLKNLFHLYSCKLCDVYCIVLIYIYQQQPV